MWPDQISNPGPLSLESDALLSALRGPANLKRRWVQLNIASGLNCHIKELGRKL